MADSLSNLIGREVVLDTAGPLIYLGRLDLIDAGGFWLADADVHRSDEGHASREQYVVEARLDGIRANRSRVYVFRHVITSVSSLADVITG